MFESNLEKFAKEVEGFWGGVVIGLDGIPVTQKSISDRINLENTSTEYITLLKKSNQINEQERLGKVEEVIFNNRNIIISLHHISGDYYFLGAFDPKSNMGMIRYKVSKFLKDLANEFA